MAKRKWPLGRWEMLGRRGGGGQADVYDVWDTKGELSGPFVLKRLKNVDRVERFKREISALKNLQGNDRIVEIVDVDSSDQPVWFVMVAGHSSLADFRPAEGFPIEESIRLFRQIAKGVAALHGAGIIHRDLKPDNIIIKGRDAKVGDLGLCLFEDMARITPSWEAVGPRYYMAPELEAGRDDDVDTRADVYSLGKILYWLLTGVTLPRERLREPQYALPGRRNHNALDEFHDVIAKAISDHKQLRSTNVDSLMENFEEAVDHFECRAQRTLSLKLAHGPISQELIHNLSADELIDLVGRATAQKIALDTAQVIAIAKRLPAANGDAIFQTLGLLDDAEFRPHLGWAVDHFLQRDEGPSMSILGKIQGTDHRRAIMLHALDHGSRDLLVKLAELYVWVTPEGAPNFEAVLARLGPPDNWPPLVIFAASRRKYPGRVEHMRAVVARAIAEEDIELYTLAQGAIIEDTGQGDLADEVVAFAISLKDSPTFRAKLDAAKSSHVDEVEDNENE